MTRWLAGYGVAAATFLALDLVWLGIMGPAVYRPTLKSLFADTVNLWPAAVFYVVYLAGVMVLAVAPGVRAQSWLVAAGLGAMLGLVAYATYDLTNMATLKTWPLHVALLDIAWGTALTATVAAAACVVMLRSA